MWATSMKNVTLGARFHICRWTPALLGAGNTHVYLQRWVQRRHVMHWRSLVSTAKVRLGKYNQIIMAFRGTLKKAAEA